MLIEHAERPDTDSLMAKVRERKRARQLVSRRPTSSNTAGGSSVTVVVDASVVVAGLVDSGPDGVGQKRSWSRALERGRICSR